MSHDDFLTCSQVARILGTSRSTVKRLCNENQFTLHRTPGGHRRIRREDVLEFIAGRDEPPQQELGPVRTSVQRSTWERLARFLLRGDLLLSLELILTYRSQKHTLAWCCDRLIIPALGYIDHLLLHDRVDGLDRQLAMATTQAIMNELQRRLPLLKETALRAVCRVSDDDEGDLNAALLMAILREAGWLAVSFRATQPHQLIPHAVKAYQAPLVCCSYARDAQLETALAENWHLREQLPPWCRIAIDARAISLQLRRELQFDFSSDSFQQMRQFCVRLQREATTARPQLTSYT